MPSLDSLSWPARRWLACLLIGRREFTRNVARFRTNDLVRNEATGEVLRVVSTPGGDAAVERVSA